jgi:hypothetical protein
MPNSNEFRRIPGRKPQGVRQRDVEKVPAIADRSCHIERGSG